MPRGLGLRYEFACQCRGMNPRTLEAFPLTLLEQTEMNGPIVDSEIIS